MARKLGTEEFWDIEGLKARRVLVRLNWDALLGGNQTLILMFCGDSDHQEGILDHLGQRAHVHLLATNGGPVWLDPEFRDPAYTESEMEFIRRYWVDRVFESIELKRTNRVGLMNHYPCGKANGLHRMRRDESEFSVVRAQRFLKQEIRRRLQAETVLSSKFEGTTIRVAPLMHYADGANKKMWWVNPDHAHFARLLQPR